MYKYGQPVEGFSTPTTGSDYAGSTVAKASRVLFAHTSEGRCPSGPQRLQREGLTRAERVDCSPLDHAQQTRNCSIPCLSDLTKEDLQELWHFTQAFPCFADLKSVDQPSGSESEVQQQQLSSLAQLLQDRAATRHPLQHKAQLQVIADRLQAAEKSSISDGSDSQYETLSFSCSSRNASADQQIPSRSSQPASKEPLIRPSQCGFGNLHTQKGPSARQSLPAHAARVHQARHLPDICHQGPAAAGLAGCYHAPAQLHTQRTSGSNFVSQDCQIPDGFVNPYAERSEYLQGLYMDPDHEQSYANSHVGPSRLGPGAKAASESTTLSDQKPQHNAQLLASRHSLQPNAQLTKSFHSIQLGQASQNARVSHSSQRIQLSHPGQHVQLSHHGCDATTCPPQHSSAEDARAVHLGPLQSRSSLQATPRSQAQKPGQDRAVPAGMGFHHSRAAQQSRTRVQQGRAAPTGPQPLRVSRRLGQKRKQALLASTFAPDAPGQDANAVKADVGATVGDKGSAASGQPMGRSGAIGAAEHLVPAAYVAGPPVKLQHGNEAVRVPPRSYTPSHSAAPADSSTGPVVALPEPSTQKGNSHVDSDESMGMSKPAQSIEVHQAFSVGALREVDLMADASDVLGLSPTRQETADGDYFAAFQDDLPADPVEGLAIPSWYELLDEAACQLTPQGFPWTAPALTESPASKKQKCEGFGMMVESGRQPDWMNQDSAQMSLDVVRRGMAPYVGEAFKMPERMSVQASQSSVLVPAAHGSDTQTQDRNRSHSVETVSAGEAAQQGRREADPAAVQTAKGGKAKRAKRGATGRQAPGTKQSMAATQDKEAGQGQTAPGQLGKQCTPSLGKVLPFDMLTGTNVEGDLAELNSRIQATCLQAHNKPADASPVHSTSRHAQQTSHSPGPSPTLALVESNGVLLLHSASGDKQSGLRPDSCSSTGAQTGAKRGAGGGGGSRGWVAGSHMGPRGSCGRANAGCGYVQLVKLSGTTSIGLPV